MKTYIYALYDKRYEDVRYIGKSNNPKQRFRNHLRDTDINHKSCWINSIGSSNVGYFIVDEVPETEWEFWEMYYISLFKCWGFNLTNMSEGGEFIPKPSYIPSGKDVISLIERNKITSKMPEKIDNGRTMMKKYWDDLRNNPELMEKHKQAARNVGYRNKGKSRK